MKIERIYKTLPNGIFVPDIRINTYSHYEFSVAVNNCNLRYSTGSIFEDFHTVHVDHYFKCASNPRDNFIICYRPVPDWIALTDDIVEL